ncbi:MAG: hypothetical protein IK990_02255 [Ruminiclostridium sp.]|nr:hypothetical protein [Ruminiclostridium sp.]
MIIYTVSFFGHRELDRPFVMEKRLEAVISDLIKSKDYVEFLVGRNGEFDQLVSSTVRRQTKKIGYANSAHILVLPYMTSEYRMQQESYERYYDEVEICAESVSAYPASAFRKRNQAMVDRSELVVCCVERNTGGAYQAMRYAERSGKKILNIADERMYDSEQD